MPRYFVYALEKGLKVLEAFNRQGGALSLTELAQTTGFNLPTATRYIRTLTDLGYLHAEAGTKRYHLTPKVLALGFTALNRMDLRTRLQPFILSLHREHKVNVNLGILSDREVLIVERLNAPHIANLDLKVGDRLPALTSSLGRAILAHLPRAEAEAVFRHYPPRSLTPHTITAKATLLAQLAEVRDRGYARAAQEMALGWVNHAVPIFGENRVQAALGVACPLAAIEKPERLEALLASLLRAGQAASVGS